MGIGITGYIIVMILVASALFVVFRVSSSKRPCPYCHTMMPKTSIKCPHCRKAVPLAY